MTAKATRIIAKAFLPNKASVDHFIQDFDRSGLAVHERRKKRVKFLYGNGQYRVTLDFFDSSEGVVRETFTEGALRYWEKLFEIKGELHHGKKERGAQ
ncbi:MAG: hypothetical protein WC791_03505 [Candidatus Paceibacterota bacterium]|jgi:hypothetical protein